MTEVNQNVDFTETFNAPGKFQLTIEAEISQLRLPPVRGMLWIEVTRGQVIVQSRNYNTDKPQLDNRVTYQGGRFRLLESSVEFELPKLEGFSKLPLTRACFYAVLYANMQYQISTILIEYEKGETSVRNYGRDLDWKWSYFDEKKRKFFSGKSDDLNDIIDNLLPE